MVNALVFFILPSGNSFKLNTIATLPLSYWVNIYSNKPYMVYGFNEDGEHYWFGEGFSESSVLLLLKEVYK